MFSRLFLLMTIITGILSGVFYWYYGDSQERMDKLRKEKISFEVAAQTCGQTVANMEIDQERMAEELHTLNNEFAAIRAQNNVLSNKLEKHDIGVLGKAKPKLVSKIVTNASANATRCIELLSGAELTDKEKAATTGKKFNAECPWLWPGAEK